MVVNALSGEPSEPVVSFDNLMKRESDIEGAFKGIKESNPLLRTKERTDFDPVDLKN